MIDKELKVLVFSVDGELYATDIMEVERILGYEEPTKLPDSPSFLEGVINYGGAILPIISLTKRFNLRQSAVTEDAKIIVGRDGNERVGIIVDEVKEVKSINLNQVENTPEMTLPIAKKYIKGLIKNDKNIIIFLNLSSVLTDKEKDLIK